MMQTLHPYTSTSTATAKTAQIMARYRPIAPRPQAPATSSSTNGGGEGGDGSSSSSSMSATIRQSPYLRNVWPHLQSRPTRTRKRGRTSLGPPPPAAFKRPRTLLQGLSPPFHIAPLVTLPLLPSSMHSPNLIDLNKAADVPEEKDLIGQLQKAPSTNVISPRPVRLVGSRISIRAIKDNDSGSGQVVKKAEEVEKELESEVLPALVSDSTNKVRLVNSAYKRMVGQPECPWLESTIGGVACNRICGEVVLHFPESEGAVSDGFSCWARIEWGEKEKEKNLVNAFGEAMRVACESKDYKFAWRFHTRQASASNV